MVLTLDIIIVIQVVTIGLLAGTLGGMLGVGGSTIIIPGLTLVLGYNQHLYQATAMIANVAVAIPAAMRHRRAGTMMPAVLMWMLPVAVVFVIVGVWASNLDVFSGREGGKWLGRVLAAFLVYVIAVNLRRLFRPHERGGATAGSDRSSLSRDGDTDTQSLPANKGSVGLRIRSVWVGTVMGSVAGLLGIGGGAIAVPLQQVVLRLPLRACIANSSAVICVSALLGSIYKNASLHQHGYHWYHSLSLALMLAPSCWIGGYLGAGLTHRLPVRQVRIVFICLMVVAAIKMAAFF